MLLTTQYRSHYIDHTGAVHDRRPASMTGIGEFVPVINLDEVREWIAIATSDEVRVLGFPGAEQDPAVHYLRLVIERGAETDDHLARETAREICDDVPVYARQWRGPFVAMRERRPLPPGPGGTPRPAPTPAPTTARIINLTPHAITLGDATFSPSGTIARAGEWVEEADPIATEDGAIPTSWVTYTRLEDLPSPEPGVYYVVSLVVAQAAAATHRSTADLLTPGEQVRDAAGRIVGCRSLARVGRGISVFTWHRREEFVAECLRQGGSSDVSTERATGNLGRYARTYASAAEAGTIAARPSDRVTFYCTTRKGRGVQMTGVPFGSPEQMDEAYRQLARGGATCNDASASEKQAAQDAVAAAAEASTCR